MVGGFFEYDSRDTPYPRALGRRFAPTNRRLRSVSLDATRGYYVSTEVTHNLNTQRRAFDFTRFTLDMREFVPVDENLMHGFAARQFVSVTRSSDGRVPFYRLQSIGGARSLRGYSTGRFHGRNVALLNAELLRRRNAIGRAYLHWGGGLDRFAVQGGWLAFQDPRAKYALAPDSLRRTVTWHVYDNQQEMIGRRLMRMQSSRESIPIRWTNAAFLGATLHASPGRTTRVFLRRVRSAATSPLEVSGSYEVVGAERQGTAESSP